MVQGNPPSSPPSPRLTRPGPSSFCWCISLHSPSPYPNHAGVLPVPLKYTHKTSCHLRVRAFAFVYGSIIPKMMKMRARMYLVHIKPIEKKRSWLNSWGQVTAWDTFSCWVSPVKQMQCILGDMLIWGDGVGSGSGSGNISLALLWGCFSSLSSAAFFL